jgi:hypothetical protein
MKILMTGRVVADTKADCTSQMIARNHYKSEQMQTCKARTIWLSSSSNE